LKYEDLEELDEVIEVDDDVLIELKSMLDNDVYYQDDNESC
jgi:hypothetical protein